jgi:hypothetical protein
VWDDPSGERIVFTTQEGISGPLPDDPSLPEELSGSICEVPADGSRRPRCLGRGKAEGMAESERLDRLFVAAWGRIAPGKRGAVYAIPRTGPLELLAEARLDDPSFQIFYEPGQDFVGVFFDNSTVMLPLKATTLAPLSEPLRAPFGPGDVFYDGRRHEGTLCFSASFYHTVDDGQGAAIIAFQGHPFTTRPLAPSSEYPWTWFSLVWGCQFDPDSRRAWASVANLGLFLIIDYDSGLILNYRFVGMGLRAMALDTGRRRIYVANFLRGDVLALDMDTGAEVARWFAGRFLRGLRLSRDHQSLLVGSNLGVLRIPLE